MAMTIIEACNKYGNTADCVALLERIRWADNVTCPYCQSQSVRLNTEAKRVTKRHHCNECRKSFTVLTGTIFHKAHKLDRWFIILALMLNAKKSRSSCEMSRDIGMRQASVWAIMTKIRQAMATKESELLKGLVEMDETFIGGKPRGIDNPRGRATGKTPVLGMIERGGKVRTSVVQKGKSLNFKTLKRVIDQNIDTVQSVLLTDEYPGYSPAARHGIKHMVMNHTKGYAVGAIHTNTIEGFWSLIKRAWYGSHHHYHRSNAHLYVGETSYVFNNRNNDNVFMDTIKRMVRAIAP